MKTKGNQITCDFLVGGECCLDLDLDLGLGSGLAPASGSASGSASGLGLVSGLAPASWFLHNVARNSPVRVSNFEI